jgi:pimeloyl-ACP methyl ester carboxylesterase
MKKQKDPAAQPEKTEKTVQKSGKHNVLNKLKITAIILLCAVVALVLADGIIAIVQIRAWMTPEKVGWDASPAEVGLDYYQFEVETPNGTVSGWKIAAQTPIAEDADEWVYTTDYSDKTIVFAPNYDSNREMNDLSGLNYITGLCAAGYNVITFDWTGSGYSDGKTNVFDLDKTEELRAVVEYAKQETGCTFLAVQGVGFGCYPAANVAADCNAVNALILDSSYADFDTYFYGHFSDWATISFAPVKETVRRLFPVLSDVDIDNVSVTDAIKRLNQKSVYFIQGEKDETFGTDDAQYLYSLAAADNTASIWIAEGCNHLRAYSALSETYLSNVNKFLISAYDADHGA